MVVVIAIAHTLVITAIAFQLFRRQLPAQRLVFWPALAFKLFTGICLGLIYTHYYTVADTFAYFQDASRAAAVVGRDVPAYMSFLLAGDLPPDVSFTLTEPRALLVTRITSVFCLLTGNNYWAIGLYFSFFSFVGSWMFVQVISRNIPSASRAAIIAFLFLPSVVFWTSGVLKESLAMAALFFLSALFLKAWFSERLNGRHAVLAVFSFWLFWNLKYYYAGVFMAVVCSSLFFRILFRQRITRPGVVRVVLCMLIVMVPAVVVTLLHPNFHVDRLLEVVVENNAAYRAYSSPDNVVAFYSLEATPLSILLNAPWALFSGLFRPFLWEVSSPVQWMAALENTAVFLFFLASFSRFRAIWNSPHRMLIVTVAVYVLVLAVLLTLSAPNFGTLSRYRAGYISFFSFLILCNNPVLQYVERSVARFGKNRKGPNLDT